MRTAERYPEFAGGWIVIDARQAPSLRHAIGARIWRQRRSAEAFAQRSKNRLGRQESQHIHVVPVEGQTEIFALAYIDADGVVVHYDGTIRMEGRG